MLSRPLTIAETLAEVERRQKDFAQALALLFEATETVQRSIPADSPLRMVVATAVDRARDLAESTMLQQAEELIRNERSKTRPGKKAPVLSFERVRQQAQQFNLYVHFVNTFEGTEYAIYRGKTKVGGNVKSPDAAVARLLREMKGEACNPKE